MQRANGGCFGEEPTVKLMARLMEHEKPSLKPVLILWFFICVFLVFGARDIIATRAGWDPDDQLRLVQLRDFLAGQSWFDSTQYRLNPPDGGPMHWSRLIELPLALIVLMAKPLFGQAAAEMIAGTAVPLIGLGLVAYMLSRIATRLGNAEAGAIAIILTLFSTPLLPQFQPMRIDHHGWQTVLAVLALWTMFWSDKKRGGIILGLALATWMHISLEGLPAAAAFFLLLGWRWVIEKEHGQRLIWTISSFALASILLFLGTQSNWLNAAPFCDTMSPPYLAAIILAAGVMLPAIAATPDNRRWRLVASLGAGAAAVAAILLIAPQCSRGAFGNLDPLVREYWYVNINEGQPIWHQYAKDALIMIAAPLCGIPALIALQAKAIGGKANKDLRVAGYFLIYAILVSFLVFRTVTVAAAFAIPLVAVWINSLFQSYRRSQVPRTRILLVACMLFLIVPGALIAEGYNGIEGIFSKPEKASVISERIADEKCQSVPSVTALSKLPRASFLVPFDMGPSILLTTQHSVLASSHHRNEKAMHDHIEIWRSLPDKSFGFIKAHGIQYIAACPSEGELKYYAEKHPKGLWALLVKGTPPVWAKPMPDMGKGIKVWRILI
jgi:hypothetical protein